MRERFFSRGGPKQSSRENVEVRTQAYPREPVIHTRSIESASFWRRWVRWVPDEASKGAHSKKKKKKEERIRVHLPTRAPRRRGLFEERQSFCLYIS